MIAVANRIKSNNLSVRNTEKLIFTINKTLKEKKLKKKTRPSILTKLDNIEDKLIHQYGTKITINSNSKNKGKIIFEFYFFICCMCFDPNLGSSLLYDYLS